MPHAAGLEPPRVTFFVGSPFDRGPDETVATPKPQAHRRGGTGHAPTEKKGRTHDTVGAYP